MYTFFFDRTQSESRAILSLLHYLSIDFEANFFIFGSQRDCPSFICKFPLAKLPAMEAKGVVLCGAHAIMRFVAEEELNSDDPIYPKNNLQAK